MTAPKPGDRLEIRWPGGPYNFLVDFDGEPFGWPAPQEGWRWISGRVVEPTEPHWGQHTFYVQQLADGVFELLPRDRPYVVEPE